MPPTVKQLYLREAQGELRKAEQELDSARSAMRSHPAKSREYGYAWANYERARSAVRYWQDKVSYYS